MPKYSFKAINESGNTVSGTIEADSLEAATNLLSERGLIPSKVREETEGLQGGFSWSTIKERLTRVKTTDLILFTKQFRTLVRAGIPIISIFQVLENQTENIKLKKIVGTMTLSIKEGSTLYDAFRKHPETFSPLYCSMTMAEAVQTKGDAVSIPAGEVDSGKMLHFATNFGEGNRQNFMAYNSDGETHVRANVCPPCRSVGFSLAGDILVCDSCGTRFKASTGAGIDGACKDYPKAEVAHTISGGTITMEIDDLLTAYQNTEKPGWP